ncbi:MAG: DinB family protein [Bacteroidota bacterium]
MTIQDLPTSEYNSYYGTYTSKVPAGPMLDVFQQSAKNTEDFFKNLPTDKHEFAYAEGKWTIKEILQHLIDTERVFSYRALWFARKNTEALPGMDQDDFNTHSQANGRSMSDLITEYRALKSATHAMLSSFSEATFIQIGTASGNPFSVRSLAFIMIGHEQHHVQVIKERYL